MCLPRTLSGIAAVAVTAFALAGCASMNVNSYMERGTELTRYRTFAWGPTEGLHTGDPRLDNNQFFDERVRADVEKGLASRGFEKTSGTPDMFVHYHANVTQKIDSREIDRQSASCEDADCRPFAYEAGTLLIDLVDPRTNKVMWRGWAEGSIDGVIDSQDWMEEKVAEAVERILARLPRNL